jgi:hypothetical protein
VKAPVEGVQQMIEEIPAMFRRFNLKPVAVALMAGLIASGPAYADRTIREELSVSPGRQITPQAEATISSTAVKVLRHIADARGALQGENPDTEKAASQLSQAEKLLDIIQASLPTTKIKDRIWVAKKHLEYEDTKEVLPDLIPIYASLDELVDYVPEAQVKAHLDKAKQALKEDDKSKATEQLQALNDALLYVEADLPLRGTRHLVDQAKAALAKGDVKAASQGLSDAEDDVVFISMSFQSPLTQAKAALYRARQDSELGEKDFVKDNLNAAVKYLELAANSPDKITRDSASDLVSEVRDLHHRLETDHEGFSARVESAWQRVKAMSERTAEYVSTGWQRFRSEEAGKKDLIEAKLQLAFARIDRFSAKDDAAAKIELAEARAYLDAATKEIGKEKQADVQALAAKVANLEKALKPDAVSHNAEMAFNDAESHLEALIRQL